MPQSYNRLAKFGNRAVDNDKSPTRHNFKKEPEQPEWNNYLGKETKARTEDQYKIELEDRKRKRN